MFGTPLSNNGRGRWRDPVVVTLTFLTAVLVVAALYLYFAAPVRAPQLEPGYQPLRMPAPSAYLEREAIEQFRAALRSEDKNTVMRAAVLLQYLPVPQLKDQLLALKKRGMEEAWVNVLPELNALGWEPAVEELRGYLLAPGMEMTTLALTQLARMPPLTCAGELWKDLNIPHDSMISAGSQVLRKWGQATPEILTLLKTVVRGHRTVISQLQSAMALIVLGEDTAASWSRIRGVARVADLETGLLIGRFLSTRQEPEAASILVDMLQRDETRMAALAALVPHEVAHKGELLAPYRKLERANQVFLVDVNLAAVGELDALKRDFAKLRPSGFRATVPVIEAMGEWHGVEALSFYQMLAPDAERGERIAMAHNLCWYPWNHRARALVRGFLRKAEDEEEVRQELRTLGFIGNDRDILVLSKYLRTAVKLETRLVAAWGILNISRGLPVTRASRSEV